MMRLNKLIGGLLAGVMLLALPALAEEPTPIRRTALIIGANNGGKERARLRFAEADARQINSVLETLGGVNSRDRLMLLNPSKADVANGIEQVRNILGRKDGAAKRTELFVYYSGHSDEAGLLLGEERFGYVELRRAIESLPADVRVVILDSCASGAMTRAKGGVKRPAFMVDDSTKVQGHAILTSSAENEAAQESDRIGGSFFTHYLVSGLRGAADASHDGRVTLNEAYQFAYNETLARTEQTHAGAQHPAFEIRMSGTGDLVMTDLRGSAARLALPAVMDGRLFVRDTKGRLAAEVRKLPGRPMELGLDAGQYNVTLISPSEVFSSSIALSDGRRTELNPADMKKVPKEWAVARGGTKQPPFETDQITPVAPKDPTAIEGAGTVETIESMEALEQEMRALSRERLQPKTPDLTPPLTGESAANVGAKVGEDNTIEPPAPPVEEIYTTVPFVLSLVPGMSNIAYMKGKIEARFMLNGILGHVDRVRGIQAGALNLISDELHGAQLSLGMGYVQGPVRGVQVAVGFNIAGGNVAGGQGSAGFNIATENLRGWQGAAGFNIVKQNLDGVQGSTGFNIVGGDLHGIQGAAGFNFVKGRASGWQASAGFNIAGGYSEGDERPVLFQTSPGFNFARGLRGAQISIVNIGGDVSGAQIGLVNIARNVKGTQIGLLNIANDVSGVPLGLISYSRTGLLHLNLWTSDSARVNVGLKIGSKHVYTLVSLAMGDQIGLDCRCTSPLAMLGVGVQVPFWKFYTAFDISAGGRSISQTTVRDGITFSGDRFATVYKARLTVGFQPFKHFGVFGGVGLNGAVGNASALTSDSVGWGPRSVDSGGSITTVVWPAVFAGLQI